MTQLEDNPWQTLSSELKYSSPWIDLTEHQVINPGGNRGIYGTVHFHNLAIGIIPLDDQSNTWLVGQWRYPLGLYSWEIPEGGGSLDVPPLESARRELKEETGIDAASWQLILEMHLSNSVTDEHCFAYLATGLSFGESSPDASPCAISPSKTPIKWSFAAKSPTPSPSPPSSALNCSSAKGLPQQSGRHPGMQGAYGRS